MAYLTAADEVEVSPIHRSSAEAVIPAAHDKQQDYSAKQKLEVAYENRGDSVLRWRKT
jgi:hypothetical protein